MPELTVFLLSERAIGKFSGRLVMILSSSQLKALKERNDEELHKGRHAKYGYPAHTIQDLLQTLEAMKKEKKKWKQLAQDRGRVLQEIAALTQGVMPPASGDDF